MNRVQLDPNDPDTVYVALFGYGVWRRSPALDGTTQFRQVFQTHFPGDTFGDRTEFDLVDLGSDTRVYLGDSSDDLAYSVLWRTNKANVPAASLLTGGTNGGWTLLSIPRTAPWASARTSSATSSAATTCSSSRHPASRTRCGSAAR